MSVLVGSPTFGAGGSEPYAAALRAQNSAVLFLHETHRGGHTIAAPMDVARWTADADEADLTLLESVTGPVLDIGCGPGRMVRAAALLGIEALGIDVSPTAIEVAREAGIQVVQGSIFETIPREGEWQTALLVDGNIGIGGDVRAMLERCSEIITPDGEIVVEVNPDPEWRRRYTGRLVDIDGRESASFPWAEIGFTGLSLEARMIGLRVRQMWSFNDRSFCRLSR